MKTIAEEAIKIEKMLDDCEWRETVRDHNSYIKYLKMFAGKELKEELDKLD